MLPLPIGTSNFKKIIDSKQRMVDKSLFIKEVVEDSAEVILITRPRRFGKTLNLSMLRYFFSNKVQGRETAGLFDGFNIAKNKAFCAEYQGKYPVIFLTFKNIKSATFTEAHASISSSIKRVYSEYRYLLLAPEMQEEDKAIAKKLQQTAETALAQIDARHYPAQLKQRGLTNILSIGIAFSGRKLGIAYRHGDL